MTPLEARIILETYGQREFSEIVKAASAQDVKCKWWNRRLRQIVVEDQIIG